MPKGVRGFLRRAFLACWSPGSWFGVPVRVHWTTFAFPVGPALVWAFQSRGWTGLAVMFLLVEGCLLSLLAHEFGHVLAARRCGIGTAMVLVLPVGALAWLQAAPGPGRREGWIAAAGPLVSVVLAVAAGLAAGGVPRDAECVVAAQARWVLEWVAWFNAILGVANLAPVFPRDGGRILRAALTVGRVRWSGAAEEDAQLWATRVVLRGVALPLWVGWVLWVWRGWGDPVGAAFEGVCAGLLHALGELEYLALRELRRNPGDGAPAASADRAAPEPGPDSGAVPVGAR